MSGKIQAAGPLNSQGEPRVCSIADALEILGDRWSLLVVRECSYGVHRFNDIQRHTGAATDILSSRLKRLEAAGIVRREPYSTRPVRHEYFLTEPGEQLFPILLSLREWGERQLHAGAPPANPVWHGCGAELHVEPVCQACGAVIVPEDLHYTSVQASQPPLRDDNVREAVS